MQNPAPVPADSLQQRALYSLTTTSRGAPPMTISDGLLSQRAQPPQLNYNIVEVRGGGGFRGRLLARYGGFMSFAISSSACRWKWVDVLQSPLWSRVHV